MTRCLVLIRSHEPLQEGCRKRSFGPAGRLVEERLKVGGVRCDETYRPVRVLRRIGGGKDPPVASFRYGGVGPGDNYALRADFADQDAIARLRRDRGAEIVGVFADPAVSPFPSAYCGAAPIGATRDVARRLGVPALRRAGLTGAGVSVAVVDTGIDGSRIPVAGGWAPTPGYVPGSSGPDCPDPRCGKGDTGPGASIHGANSHPDVFTVGAVTVTDRRLGYSSQGPGALHSRKPDLAGFSHFAGSGIYPADGGTSAASPVAAGVAAAPRPRLPPPPPAPAPPHGLFPRAPAALGGGRRGVDPGVGGV